MLSLYSLNFPLALACAIFFYRAGEFEQKANPGIKWAALSILVSLAIWAGLRGGFIALFLGQVALFCGITLYRYRKNRF
jgi:hypothetical protein